ncbi:amidohydrolase family protein [Rhodococcus koreensis]
MARYTGPIVDVDIHHKPKTDAELVAYLPKRWREYVAGDGHGGVRLTPVSHLGGYGLTPGSQTDHWGSDGSRPGSSLELIKEQLLDRHNYWRVVLTHDQGEWGSHLNPYFGRAVCRAYNDWNIDTWLTWDDRFYSTVALPSGEPEEAAAEIRRVGGHPRMASVLIGVNALGRPIGDPLYHPIYEAAVEMGLQVSVHPSPYNRPNSSVHSVGGGRGLTEWLSQVGQQGMAHIASLIVHGVFEKYPDLRVVIKEHGLSWLPSLMWKLDDNYDMLRFESPWVKRWPSEYIRDHIKLSTQPIEESTAGKGGLARLLQSVDGMEELLCFSTDYPHPTDDEPEFAMRQFPTAWLPKVFCSNACDVYGWVPPPLSTPAQSLAGATR